MPCAAPPAPSGAPARLEADGGAPGAGLTLLGQSGAPIPAAVRCPDLRRPDSSRSPAARGPPLELQPALRQLSAELGELLRGQQAELLAHLDRFALRCRAEGEVPHGQGEAPGAGPGWAAAAVEGPHPFDVPLDPSGDDPDGFGCLNNGGRSTLSRMSVAAQSKTSAQSRSTVRKFSEKAATLTMDQMPEGRRSQNSEISMDEVIIRKSTAPGRMIDNGLRSKVPPWLRAARSTEGWRPGLLRMTKHWVYEIANAALILTNALLTAWETEYNAHRPDEPSIPTHFVVFMFAFCFIFSGDLAARFIAKGVDMFYERDWKWNVLDFFVVLGSCMEVFAYLTSSMEDSWLSNASVVRVVRLVRVARIVRALRSFVYFRDVRITVAMLCDAMIPLATFSCIMGAVFMVFGIFFTAGATTYMRLNGEDEALSHYYGGLFKSMATLYMSISGGINWESAATPLSKLSRFYSVVFYGYLTFSIFAMLNVVSAIFIDNTMQRSKNDRDFVVQTEMEGKRDFLNSMDAVFDELDHDRSGTICLQELQSHIMDPQVNAYFRAIDLNVFKVTRLFELMDKDGSGDIDKKEFTQGCARLRGEAKELDVAILQLQMKQIAAVSTSIRDLVVQLGAHLDDKFDPQCASLDVSGQDSP